jgi:hypothetical protein
MGFQAGDTLWLLTSGEPRAVTIVRQVLFNVPAYRVRLLALDNDGEVRICGSACVEGIYLSRHKPRGHRNMFHGWGGARQRPRRDDELE